MVPRGPRSEPVDGFDALGIGDRCGHVLHGGKLNAVENYFFPHTFVPQCLFRRTDAGTAIVDRACGSAPEFEIDTVCRVTAWEVHAQSSRDRFELESTPTESPTHSDLVSSLWRSTAANPAIAESSFDFPAFSR